MPKELYDAIVIGGGFYGLSVALHLRDVIGLKNIKVIERYPAMMSRASYVNQARVHNGYHYPRSILTASRSAHNFQKFVDDYKEAVVSDFDKYYAVARTLSKVNAKQFLNFSQKIGAPIQPASNEIESMFSQNLIENVYKVKEFAFNSTILRDLLLRRIATDSRIELSYNQEVDAVVDAADGYIQVVSENVTDQARRVFNCTYSQINRLHEKSGLKLVPMKHEITEMCLVKLPSSLSKFSVTIMDGPFFSIMPFPSRPGLSTLSHVRYTPHTSWLNDERSTSTIYDPHDYLRAQNIKTNYKKMKADAVRFIPELAAMEYAGSIVEVKTVLQKSETDDSRPILFSSDFGIDGYTCIMGGKLDNIYDVFEELEDLYGK